MAEVPEELDALVAQMLAKEPAQRPSDGANLAAALAAPARSPTVAAQRRRPPRGAARPGPRRSPAASARLFSVVLLGPPAADAPPAPNHEANTAPGALRPHGGRLEQLADGAVIVVLEGDRQVATDQAAQAARCALRSCAASPPDRPDRDRDGPRRLDAQHARGRRDRPRRAPAPRRPRRAGAAARRAADRARRR